MEAAGRATGQGYSSSLVAGMREHVHVRCVYVVVAENERVCVRVVMDRLRAPAYSTVSWTVYLSLLQLLLAHPVCWQLR